MWSANRPKSTWEPANSYRLSASTIAPVDEDCQPGHWESPCRSFGYENGRSQDGSGHKYTVLACAHSADARQHSGEYRRNGPESQSPRSVTLAQMLVKLCTVSKPPSVRELGREKVTPPSATPRAPLDFPSLGPDHGRRLHRHERHQRVQRDHAQPSLAVAVQRAVLLEPGETSLHGLPRRVERVPPHRPLGPHRVQQPSGGIPLEAVLYSAGSLAVGAQAGAS